MQSKYSFRAVNFLYMIVVLLQAANLLLMFLPQYVRLILNELFFVFLPAYLYLRLTRQPVAERVRWRWPGGRLAALSLLVGMGLYPLSAVSAGVLLKVLGYTSFATAPDAIPTTVLMAVLAVIAYAVMAPLCEEFLFRGVIQPVFERRGAAWAVIFSGLLFVMFHLSLLQGLSIILLSLALGVVNYRTRSLPASILTHVGANGLASLILIQQVFDTGVQNWITSLPAVVGGLATAAASLALLFRLTRPAAVEQPAADELPAAPAAPSASAAPRRSWIAQVWPLLVVELIFLLFIGSEFISSRSPQLAAQPLAVGSAPWQSPQRWSYEIRNIADDVVGEGECRLDPQAAETELVCTSQVGAYEVQLGNSFYSSSGGERIDTLRWQAQDGQLISGASDLNLTGGAFRSETSWSRGSDAIDIRRAIEDEPEQLLTFPLVVEPLADQTAMLIAFDYTWPWQLAGLPLEQGASGRVLRFQPYTWRNKTQDNGPVLENWLVTVTGQEEVLTPAGTFTAWKVTLGSSQAAWYAADDSRQPVKFFNGVETWTLK